MRPVLFVGLLKQWLLNAGHPGIVDVRTCAEVGRWEQPIGVRVTLTDGWGLVVQVVRSSPAGGDQHSSDLPPGPWSGDPVYQQARTAADADTATVAKVRGGKPRASVGQVLTVVLAAVTGAAHPDITAAEVSAKNGGQPVLRVTCADGSTLYGLPAGWLAPGSAEFMHPAHAIPADWY